MSKGIMKALALLMALCLLGGSYALADAPFSVQAGTDTAFIGPDSKVWLMDANKAISEATAMELVSADALAAYYLDAEGQLVSQPLDGGAPTVLASAAASPVALNGTFYYLDATSRNQVYRVAPNLNAQLLATAEGSENALRAVDGELLLISGVQRKQINLANGALGDVEPAPVAEAPELVLPEGVSLAGEIVSDGVRAYAVTEDHQLIEFDPATGEHGEMKQFLESDAPMALSYTPGHLFAYSLAGDAPRLLESFPRGGATPTQTVEPELPVLDEEEELPEATIALDDTPPTPGATLAPTPRPEKTAGPSGYASLTRGDRGELVRNLQKRLIELGYLSGGADGDFGYNTQLAVKAFQKRAKLDEDGEASIALQQKLFAKDAPKALAAYAELEKGDKGAAVKNIQARLKKLNYYAGPEDGKFSSQLQTAVKLFQKAAGLKQSGKATVETQKKLFASSAPKHSLNKLIALRPGDSGERVKKLQKRLQKLGYFTGEIGGHYQTLTTKAVKRFQKQIGEDADGVASVGLLEQIYADDAPEYEG